MLLALVLVGGCYVQESGDPEQCWGLIRTEQRCVYRPPSVDGVVGYECAKLRHVSYDYRTLPDSEVVFDCREPDSESTITILKTEDCEIHFVGGCVE